MSETDLQLLARYARTRAEDAFVELVQRHIDLVYSAALRQVRAPQFAEEITQSVFLKLSREADRLKPSTIVAAWLYQVARREAIDTTRREVRRQLREQIASEMNAIDATPDDWLQIEPLLDEAMQSLDEPDRAAILLRYFENKSLREVGLAIGTSDDAAQKRVSRAIERLRDFFGQRGIRASAAGLGLLISTQAVQSAPATLAAGITAAAVAGAVVHTATAVAATKAIAMTTMQKSIVSAVLAIGVGTGIYEAHEASALRAEGAALQQQQASLTEQVRQLMTERDEAVKAAEKSARSENETVQRHTAETLRLREKLNQLQRQVAVARSGNPPYAAGNVQKSVEPADTRTVHQNEMTELGLAASRGDVAALEKLAELSLAAYKAKTNNNHYTHGDVSLAFKVMGEEAGKGSETALQMLWRGTRTKYLDGMAIAALGQAAAMGNEKALEPLLDPEKFLLLRSSAVFALRAAVDNGNDRAIQAMAAVANDPKQQALWWQVAQSLQKPATAGNTAAIDALTVLARAENKQVQRSALLSLENAAYKQYPKAIEALKALGYQ